MDDMTRREAILKAVAGIAGVAAVAAAAAADQAPRSSTGDGDGACEVSGCPCTRWRGNKRNEELDFCAEPCCGHSKFKHA